MWIGVTPRFRQFHADLLLTDGQIEDGIRKQLGVRQSLHRAYWGELNGEDPLGFMVGSWGKGTQVRPPTDIDIMFPLPHDVAERFDRYASTVNKQSALLREVKGVLAKTYPQTDLRGDGQVVVVGFNTITVEVVPCFLAIDGSGQYVIGDTNNGGRWKRADPFAEMGLISRLDAGCNGNVRTLIKMLKVWKREQNVPLKSFILELLVGEFIVNSPYKALGYYFYDWLIEDFFRFLVPRAWGSVTMPGTGEIFALGADWKMKAEKALAAAVTACEYERSDYTVLAGEEWRKIFGPRIPVLV
jgi:hypothetical protein